MAALGTSQFQEHLANPYSLRTCDRQNVQTLLGEFHETSGDVFISVRFDRGIRAGPPGPGVGMQGPPDGGVDCGEAFDTGSAGMGAEAAERESDRSEIEALLRRGD